MVKKSKQIQPVEPEPQTTELTPEELDQLASELFDLPPEEQQAELDQLPPEVVDQLIAYIQEQQSGTAEGEIGDESQMTPEDQIGDPSAEDPNMQDQMQSGMPDQGMQDPNVQQGMNPEEMEPPLVPSLVRGKKPVKIAGHTDDGFPLPVQGNKIDSEFALQPGGTPYRGKTPDPDWWTDSDHRNNISKIKRERRSKRGLV
jgi:hypothetical protein